MAIIAGGGCSHCCWGVHQWVVALILDLTWLLLSAAGWFMLSSCSGHCSQRESFHPQAASQRRSSAAGLVE